MQLTFLRDTANHFRLKDLHFDNHDEQINFINTHAAIFLNSGGYEKSYIHLHALQALNDAGVHMNFLYGNENEVVLHTDKYIQADELSDVFESVGSALLSQIGNALKNKIISEFKKTDTYKDSEFFQMIFPKSEDQIINEKLDTITTGINDILQKIADLEYKSLEMLYTSNRAWLRTTYSNSLQTYHEDAVMCPPTSKTKEQVMPLITSSFSDLGHKNGELRKVISYIESDLKDADLENCDFSTRLKVLLYTNCVLLNVLFIREQLFWANEADYVFNDVSLNSLANTAKKDLSMFLNEYKTNITAYSDKLRKGRLNKASSNVAISQFAQQSAYSIIYTIEGSWHDDFESKTNNDPFWGDKISKKSVRTSNAANLQKVTNMVLDDLSPGHKSHWDKVNQLVIQEVTSPLLNALDALNQYNPNTYDLGTITGYFKDFWYNGGSFSMPVQGNPHFLANVAINPYTFFYYDYKNKTLWLKNGLAQIKLFSTQYDELNVYFDANAKAFIVNQRKIVDWKEERIPETGTKIKYPVFSNAVPDTTFAFIKKEYMTDAKTSAYYYEISINEIIIQVSEIIHDPKKDVHFTFHYKMGKK